MVDVNLNQVVSMSMIVLLKLNVLEDFVGVYVNIPNVIPVLEDFVDQEKYVLVNLIVSTCTFVIMTLTLEFAYPKDPVIEIETVREVPTVLEVCVSYNMTAKVTKIVILAKDVRKDDVYGTLTALMI